MSNATQRQPREKVLRLVQKIEAEIRPSMDPLISAFDWAGSIRRCQPTVGDLDLVICLRPGVHHATISATLRNIAEGGLLVTDGQTKKSLRLRGSGIKMEVYCAHDRLPDLIQPVPSNHGIILHTATGSYEWNLGIVSRASRMGYRYCPFMGLLRLADGAVIGSETEADLFAALNLPFTPPENRNRL